jgi:hypothetical protein
MNQQAKIPVEARAEHRRAEWEKERIAKIRQMVARMTEAEARERGA